MNRDDLIGFAEGAVLTSVLYALFVYLLFFFNTYPPSLIVLVLTFSVVATVLLSGLFLPKFSFATSSVRPEQILAQVSYQLRRKGFRVEDAGGLKSSPIFLRW